MISEDKYSCFGDMNRMTSQWKRGGAFYCLEDPTLNEALRKIIVSTDTCIPKQLKIFKKALKNLKSE